MRRIVDQHSRELNAICERVVEIARRLGGTPDLEFQLQESGLPLALVGQALANQVGTAGRRLHLSPKALLQLALAGTEFALAEDPEKHPAHPFLVRRDMPPPGLTLLPDSDARLLYRSVLERDNPRLFLPKSAQLHELGVEARV